MSKTNDVQPTAVNLICEGTTIRGNIEATRDIRIDGYINGEINASGKVVIGEASKIEGDINCKTIDISGTIQGNINIKETVCLKATALVFGNITTDKIIIESGANFTGSCKMGESKHKTNIPKTNMSKINAPEKKEETK